MRVEWASCKSCHTENWTPSDHRMASPILPLSMKRNECEFSGHSMWPLFFPYSWLPCLWQVMVKRRHSLPLCCTSKEGNRKWRIAFMEYLQSSELEEGLHTQPGKLYFLLFTEERTDVQERWVTCPRALSQKSQCQNSNPVDTPKATILPREGTLVPFFFFFNFFGHTLRHVGS